MIDFEDDALEVMSLAEAQSRDWLAYLSIRRGRYRSFFSLPVSRKVLAFS